MKDVPGAALGIPDDETVVGHLISRARSALLTGLDGELEPFGLTGAQFAVLKNVADGTAATAADLCRTMHYDTGSMTRMLDRLEEKSVLRRERCTEDRRVVYACLTDEGRELTIGVTEDHFANELRMLSGLTEPESKQLAKLLRKLERSLHEAERGS